MGWVYSIKIFDNKNDLFTTLLYFIDTFGKQLR